MRRNRVTLFVYGSKTYLGREVARFARAMGHRTVGIVDGEIPEPTEPWMHGIHWVSEGNPLEQTWPDPPLRAILYCHTALWDGDRHRFEEILYDRPRQLIESAQRGELRPRFVLRSTVPQPLLPSGHLRFHRKAEEVVLRSDLPSAIFRLPLLYGPDRPDSVAAMVATRILRRAMASGLTAPMRVETAALAMLRAALEPEIEGIFEPEEIEGLGDVMIAQ